MSNCDGIYGDRETHGDPVATDTEKVAHQPEQQRMPSGGQSSEITLGRNNAQTDDNQRVPYDPNEHGFRRIIRNFTPS